MQVAAQHTVPTAAADSLVKLYDGVTSPHFKVGLVARGSATLTAATSSITFDKIELVADNQIKSF